jgi:hypothetical protein
MIEFSGSGERFQQFSSWGWKARWIFCLASLELLPWADGKASRYFNANFDSIPSPNKSGLGVEPIVHGRAISQSGTMVPPARSVAHTYNVM